MSSTEKATRCMPISLGIVGFDSISLGWMYSKSSRRPGPSGVWSIAMFAWLPSRPTAVSVHSPLTVSRPMTVRPRSVKKAMVASRSRTAIPTFSRLMTMRCMLPSPADQPARPTFVRHALGPNSRSEEGRGVLVEDAAQPRIIDARYPGDRAHRIGVAVRDVGEIAAEQDAVTQVSEPRRLRRRKGHEFVDERRESHGGIEPHVGRALADVEKLHILQHPHVRDDQSQPRISLQQNPYGLRTGVLAGCRPGPAVNDNRHPGVFDGSPDAIEHRVVGLVSADLNVRLEDLRSVADRGLDVVRGLRLGIKRRGRNANP